MAQRLQHLLLSIIFLVNLIRFSSQQGLSFVYNGFDQDQDNIHLDGVARIHIPGGLLQLTDDTKLQTGHAFFNRPFDFDSASSDDQPLSFSTHFVCALVRKPGDDGGHGIAFVLSSSMDLTEANPTQYLGLLNTSSNGYQILAVELDTVKTAEFDDIDNNHVGIDENSLNSVVSASASYYSDREGRNKSLTLLSGDPMHVWIDYEGTLLNVTLAPLTDEKPSKPLLSRNINLTAIFPDRKAFVGFSAATGTLVSYQYILGWSFSTSSASLQSLDISKLPTVPHPKINKETSPLQALLIILVVILALVVMSVLGGVLVYRRKKYAEVKEPWEKPYGPMRYSYKTLYKATRGFNKDGCLGKGVETVLKLGLLCTCLVPDSRPTMEQVVQFINRYQTLPDFSPDTPGIGVSMPVLTGIPSLAITSTSEISSPSVSSSSANNSMFISHTIIYGDGR
ncbi:unnamed protein product [Eruca vesicaria subsp. sativa]|uniref:Legume lectin domain-containing protein n=1 Tax=Eruca vesicaria subsp. sativa TaxID=29727 RepID=A0ABC8JDD9_ERUVS|nr:unnamed protein product [Eruca vesicaria subsp. sativa]